jgi:hypothetical protein
MILLFYSYKKSNNVTIFNKKFQFVKLFKAALYVFYLNYAVYAVPSRMVKQLTVASKTIQARSIEKM